MAGHWLIRLSEERAELSARVKRLEKFLSSDEFNLLSNLEQGLLLLQYSHMRMYLVALVQRLQLHDDE